MTLCRKRYVKNMKNMDLFWNNEETGSGRMVTDDAFFAFAAEEAFFGV